MTDTLGYRKIFGVLVPGMNTVVQPELERLRPAGVTNQTARFTVAPGLKTPDIMGATQVLMACKPEALIVGLSTESVPGGVDALAKLCEELNAVRELPVFNASHASYAALHALGAERIAVVTPFTPAINETVRENVKKQGFSVVAVEGTEASSLEAIAQTSLDLIERVFHAVDRDNADAILQLGTALPVVALVADLEADFGKPIVACNAAVYWQALRESGIDDKLEGLGRLLSDL